MISPEKILKKIVLSSISPLFKKLNKETTLLGFQHFKKVLIFRLDNKLGNAVLLLPLIQSIKNSAPHIKIDVLYSSDYAQVFENHPAINSLILYDQKYLLKNPIRFITLINTLRKNEYNVVFSSTNSNSFSVSQALFAGILKSERTIGFDWKDSSKIYTDVVKGNTEVHYAMAQVDLWRYFDPDAKNENPKIYFEAKDKKSTNKNTILFWLGATGNKILPKELVEKILKFIKSISVRVHFAAGPHDNDIIQNYSFIDKNKILVLTGSLKDTATFLNKYQLIIMPDTGPLHLAVALGIPVVQVFVNSNPIWYAYQGENLLLINKTLNEKEFLHFVKKILH